MLGPSYHNPKAPYGKKRRKNARLPVTMPYEAKFSCGHRCILRFTLDQLGWAAEEVARLETKPCSDCEA